jgi:hypothetical protein
MLPRSLVSLALLASATLAAPVPRAVKDSRPYFPTTVGTKWVYETPGGALESAVVSAVEKDGDDLIVSREGVDGTRTVYSKMLVSAEGLRQEREFSGGKIGWVLKATLKPGDSWDMPEGGKRTVIGPEEVEVPAGKFDALRVEWEQSGMKQTSWYARGVGEVKRVTKSGNTETVTRTLKSFEPKGEKK